jgi:hypothetical protein
MWGGQQVPNPPSSQNVPAAHRFPHPQRMSTLQTRNVMNYGSSSAANVGGHQQQHMHTTRRVSLSGANPTDTTRLSTNYCPRPTLPGETGAYGRMTSSSTPLGYIAASDPRMYGGMPGGGAHGGNLPYGGGKSAVGGMSHGGAAAMGAGGMPHGMPYGGGMHLGGGGMNAGGGGMNVGGGMPHSQRIQAMRMMKMQSAKHQLVQKKKREDAEFKKVRLWHSPPPPSPSPSPSSYRPSLILFFSTFYSIPPPPPRLQSHTTVCIDEFAGRD